MILTDAEKAMLDGARGPAHRKAMELLVRYGEALGAERFVEVRNVATVTTVTNPIVRKVALAHGMDGVFSRFNLDSDEIVETPTFEAATCQLIHGIYREQAGEFGVAEEAVRLHDESERFFGRRGVQMLSTCTPYQVGNVPTLGEHCAWMESSAVVYCNSVLGGRTNTEGRESTSAAAVTGRIPYWGLHVPENRFGDLLFRAEIEVESMRDWGLFGYHVGEIAEDGLPVLDGVRSTPNLPRLKHFGASAASSGGVELFHIPGVTPEARTVDEALKPGAARRAHVYGAAERRRAYERLNSGASDTNVDFVMLGCPHDSIEQVWEAARLLDGKRISANVHLWIHAPRAIKEVADRSGYTAIIEGAGGRLLSDTCPAISRILPKGVKVVATDSAKQAHYLPAIALGTQAWFGSLEDCINAALTGRWSGDLP
jgi:predicted aconitase